MNGRRRSVNGSPEKGTAIERRTRVRPLCWIGILGPRRRSIKRTRQQLARGRGRWWPLSFGQSEPEKPEPKLFAGVLDWTSAGDSTS